MDMGADSLRRLLDVVECYSHVILFLQTCPVSVPGALSMKMIHDYSLFRVDAGKTCQVFELIASLKINDILQRFSIDVKLIVLDKKFRYIFRVTDG